jgi:hypothetical protein
MPAVIRRPAWRLFAGPPLCRASHEVPSDALFEKFQMQLFISSCNFPRGMMPSFGVAPSPQGREEGDVNMIDSQPKRRRGVS